MGAQLQQFYCRGAGLTEVPHELALMSDVEVLDLRNNDILWVHHTLGRYEFAQLCALYLRGNRRLPLPEGDDHFFAVHARPALHTLSALDAAYRARIYCLMGVLRIRLHAPRDVVRLVGRALWDLRW